MNDITLADFPSEVLQSQTPVLVDIYTDTCLPCREIAPVLEQIALARGSAFKIVKVNATTQGPLATQLGVRSVPTLLLFLNGRVLGQRSGAVSRPDLENWLNEKLAAAQQ
jgi:thioredoxin 1